MASSWESSWMTLPWRSWTQVLVLVACVFIPNAVAISSHTIGDGSTIIGRVKIDGYFFSSVRVDVSARYPGKVQVALTENRRTLSELVLEPLREEYYYEVREPFSMMSLLKSPMGLMVGFMLIVVFLMPKLVENMDPEEMRQAQEQMRSQGIPSLSSLLPGNNN